MKKIIVIACALLLVVVVVFGLWNWLWSSKTSSGKTGPLKATMKDEDAPRPSEPSLALMVNEGQESTVFAGTPVWFQLNAANTAAMNDAAGTKILAGKIARMTADVAQKKAPPAELQRMTADYQKRTAASTIVLGDASHPWTEAVKFVLRDDKGSEQPFGLVLKPLGDPRNTVELDTIKTLQGDFGTASSSIAPGTYSVTACLGATGSWKGRVCSDPVKLTVETMPANLSADQQLALDRQRARFGLKSADYKSVEAYGRKLVAADPSSIAGHIYLGEAKMGQEKWDEALKEFLRARVEYNRQKSDAVDKPQYINARINQLLEKTLDK